MKVHASTSTSTIPRVDPACFLHAFDVIDAQLKCVAQSYATKTRESVYINDIFFSWTLRISIFKPK